MQNRLSWRWALLALIAASLACNLPSFAKAEPTVAVSDQAAQELQQGVATAIQQAAQTGSLSLEVTESQITSALALKLAESSAFPISDVQVRLKDGQVQLSGKTNQNGIELPVQMTASVAVQDCKPKLSIESASVGPIPLPQEQLTQFLPMAEDAIQQMIQSTAAANLCLNSLTISEGKMTITGQVPQ